MRRRPFEYAYDFRGNIISEKRGGLITTYAYDALGQLVRVNDPHENATWIYTYDRGGNILSKKRYAYTTGTLGIALETIPYTYGDSNWKDKLTAYNGKTITYDAIGNPLNDGKRTYTWGAGRQLQHISMLTGEEHGFRAGNGVHEDSSTRLRIVHDEVNSKLKAKLLRDGRDITDERAASAFVWTKNDRSAGTGKEIAVTDAEVNGDVQFSCTYTETQGVYGTVSVNNSLVASYTPATADANHVFSLENSMLKVEIPNNTGNGTGYELIDGVLSVNPGFTGSITAEYEFITRPTREIDFAYDHNGLRTQKKVVENGITTIYDYTLHGKLITHLTKRTADENGTESTEELHFFYDAQSRPAKVSYNGVMYTYIHNLQGDIVGILDSSGNLVVEYRYDVWGKLLSMSGLLAGTLGKRNPFRYRGYIYDEETELYYLCERYYNSTWERFLNCDKNYGKREGILSFSLFTYCANMPVNNFDRDGCDFFSWISDKWGDLCFEISNTFRALEVEGGVGGGIGASGKISGIFEASAFASVDLARITADDNILSLDQAIVLDAGVTIFDDLGVDTSYRKPRDLRNPYEDIPAELSYTLGYGQIGLNGDGEKADLIIEIGGSIGLGIAVHGSVGINASEWQDRRTAYYSKKHFKEIFAQRPRKIIVGMGRTRRVATLI